ncbi:MAG: tyrosine-type recombinase/integrase [Anaerolineales bacterium]|nr:tyrosine-type recombinase/integrase [Anaerolineales bacterium]
MTLEKVNILLANCLDTGAGLQMQTIIYILWDTWIRASEVCNLKLEHINLEERQFSVLTKGSNWEIKSFTQPTVEKLNKWIHELNKTAGKDCRTLFCNTVTGKPLTRDGLRGNFNRLGKRSGIKVSPHDFQ